MCFYASVEPLLFIGMSLHLHLIGKCGEKNLVYCNSMSCRALSDSSLLNRSFHLHSSCLPHTGTHIRLYFPPFSYFSSHLRWHQVQCNNFFFFSSFPVFCFVLFFFLKLACFWRVEAAQFGEWRAECWQFNRRGPEPTWPSTGNIKFVICLLIYSFCCVCLKRKIKHKEPSEQLCR